MSESLPTDPLAVTERLTDEQLQILIGTARAQALTPKSMTIHQREVQLALMELQALRRHEYICTRCGIRKDSECEHDDF